MSSVYLIDKTEIANNTTAFRFSKPKEFSFIAGQHIELKSPKLSLGTAGGNNRVFSIASAPIEKEIVIVTRMTNSIFKKELLQSKADDEFEMNGPWGDCILHKDVSKPAVFIAGGIGITLARSIIVDSLKRETKHNIFLFYSDRLLEDMAFRIELEEMSENNDRFHLIETLTGNDLDNSWNGERGRVDEEMIKKYISEDLIRNSIFYISGASSMVRSIKNLLRDMGVFDENVRSEEFSGY